jgi:hypothetical protein
MQCANTRLNFTKGDLLLKSHQPVVALVLTRKIALDAGKWRQKQKPTSIADVALAQAPSATELTSGLEGLTKPLLIAIRRGTPHLSLASGLQIQPNKRSQTGLCKMPSVMTGRGMRHARQSALIYQVFVCLRPGWDGSAGWDPVGVRGFVTPFHETRHHVRMRFGAAKRLQSALAFPHSQGPERATSVYEESSAEESRCAPDLALSKKGLPHERRNVPYRANANTGNGCKHSLSILGPREFRRGRPELVADVCRGNRVLLQIFHYMENRT